MEYRKQVKRIDKGTIGRGKKVEGGNREEEQRILERTGEGVRRSMQNNQIGRMKGRIKREEVIERGK